MRRNSKFNKTSSNNNKKNLMEINILNLILMGPKF